MWLKFSDQMPQDPDIDELSDGAFRLWVTAICETAEEDGKLRKQRVKRIVPNYRKTHLDELLSDDNHSGRPLLFDEGEHYRIRNFEKYQPTGKTREALQKKKSLAGAFGNHKRWHTGKGVYDDECGYCTGQEEA